MDDARGDEAFGDGGGGVAEQQRGREGEGEMLDEAAGDGLGRFGAFEHRLDAGDQRIERGVRAAGGGEFGGEGGGSLGRAGQRAQHVEADDVARPFPDAVQRGLAVEPGDRVFLDEAVAAVAFQRLGEQGGGALAGPVFRDRDDDPGEGGRGRVTGGGVGRGGGAQGEPERRLGLQRHVGEDGAHQRLVDQGALEGAAMGGVVQGERGGLAHQRRGAERAFEAGEMRHLDDGGDAAALGADHDRLQPVELDLGGGVGAVAELVLQALDAHRVAAAVVAPALGEEAGDRLAGAGEGEEEIAGGDREEPFVAGQAPRIARAGRGGAGLAQIRAALFLGHRHRDAEGRFFRRRQRARVVAGRENPVAEAGEQVGRVGEGGGGGEGHRRGAADAGLALAPEIGHGGAGDMGAGAGFGPGQAVEAVGADHAHQAVPGGVEGDLVDAVAEAVEGGEFGRVAIRLPRQGAQFGRADSGADRGEMGGGPAGAEGGNRLEKGGIAGEGVVRRRFAGLVENLVRDGHGGSIAARARLVSPGIVPPGSIDGGARCAYTLWRCGCSSMVEFQPSKLAVRVRFPSPAPLISLDFFP